MMKRAATTAFAAGILLAVGATPSVAVGWDVDAMTAKAAGTNLTPATAPSDVANTVVGLAASAVGAVGQDAGRINPAPMTGPITGSMVTGII